MVQLNSQCVVTEAIKFAIEELERVLGKNSLYV